MRRFSLFAVSCGATLALALALRPQFAFAQDAVPDIIKELIPQAQDLAFARERVIELLLTVAAGYIAGAFLSPKLRPFRTLLWRSALVLALLYSIIGPSPAADMVGLGVKILSFCFMLLIGMGLGRLITSAKYERPTSFGSAKWATYDYLAENKLFGSSGFLLGEFAEADRCSPLRYEGARHLLTVAPTRSGKGVSSIVPNLLLHEGSALIVDPKGENALIAALRRGSGDAGRGIMGMGQEVVLLDPWDIAASTLGREVGCFNPLDWIRDGDPDSVENAFLLADALVIKEGGGDSAFWDEEAKALLTGVILYVATAPEEAEHRHLGRVRDILTLDDNGLQEVLLQMFQHPMPVVSSTAARTVSKEAKLRSSVMASAQAHTHFLDSPRIRESLGKSDFRFEDLKAKRLTVFLILPADRLVTFNRWLRLLIQQAITVNARNIDEKPAKPILFMLDEMPTLGRLPSIEQAYGLMAGFGMQLWGIVQDLSQLARIYGEHGWQSFLANSGVIQYMGSRDKMTAEYFSSLCGVTTIAVHNFSHAVGEAVSVATGSSSSGSTSTTTHSSNWGRTHGVSDSQRQLAYPDELMVLRGNEQLVFVENLDPIAAHKVVWYEDARLSGLGVNLQKPAPVLIEPGVNMLPSLAPKALVAS